MKLLTHSVNSAIIPLCVFIVGLFLLPLIYSVSPRLDYELVKVAFFQRWVEVFCLAVVVFNFEKISIKKLLTRTNLILFAFYVVAFLASYFGVDYSKSFWGNDYRSDGLFTLFHGVLLFVFLQFAWDANWRKHTAHTIVLSSIVVSLFALGHGIPVHSPFDGIYGTLAHPAFLGGFLALTLPFFLVHKSRLVWILFVLPIMAILGTHSRFAVLGVFSVLVAWRFSLGAKLFHIPGVLAFLYTIFSLCYFGYFIFKATTITQEYVAGNNVVYEDRMRIYAKGFLGFLKQPILGYGFANFDKVFEAIDWPTRFPNDVYVDKAHSNWLENLVTTGIIGFIFYFSFVIFLFNRLKWNTPFNKAVTISFFIYLLNAQVNVTSIAQDALFWTFAGILTKESYN